MPGAPRVVSWEIKIIHKFYIVLFPTEQAQRACSHTYTIYIYLHIIYMQSHNTYLINCTNIKQVLVEQQTKYYKTHCNNLKQVHNYKTVYKVTMLKHTHPPMHACMHTHHIHISPFLTHSLCPSPPPPPTPAPTYTLSPLLSPPPSNATTTDNRKHINVHWIKQYGHNGP